MRISSRYAAHLLVLIATGAVLAGCTRGTNDLDRWIAQEKDKPGADPEPLPDMKTFEKFVYLDKDAQGEARRDPFGPSASEVTRSVSSGPHPDENRPREPLEAYPLDVLKMVGTIGAGKSIQALIKDPGGVIHREHTGNYLGQNYGRIIAIAEDHVDLVELVPRGDSWMEHQAKIALADTEK